MSAPASSRTVTVAARLAVGVLERLEPAHVDRPRDFGRVARARCDVDGGRDAGGHRGRAQRRGEAARLEQRRVDPLRKLRRLVQRLLHVAPHLFEEPPRRSRVGVRQGPASCEVDRERDQLLLHAVVQVALDPPAVCVGRQDEPLPGRAQLRDLSA